MPLDKKQLILGNYAKVSTKLLNTMLLLSVLFLPNLNATETLAAKELVSRCKMLKSDPNDIDGQYCVRYVQGFIDGAIATDARVMLSAETATAGKESYAQRAMRTRIPGRVDQSRAAKLAGFCLGGPLSDVVEKVVADLISLPNSSHNDEAAMEVVYNSLLKNYPCK